MGVKQALPPSAWNDPRSGGGPGRTDFGSVGSSDWRAKPLCTSFTSCKPAKALPFDSVPKPPPMGPCPVLPPSPPPRSASPLCPPVNDSFARPKPNPCPCSCHSNHPGHPQPRCVHSTFDRPASPPACPPRPPIPPPPLPRSVGMGSLSPAPAPGLPAPPHPPIPSTTIRIDEGSTPQALEYKSTYAALHEKLEHHRRLKVEHETVRQSREVDFLKSHKELQQEKMQAAVEEAQIDHDIKEKLQQKERCRLAQERADQATRHLNEERADERESEARQCAEIDGRLILLEQEAERARQEEIEKIRKMSERQTDLKQVISCKRALLDSEKANCLMNVSGREDMVRSRLEEIANLETKLESEWVAIELRRQELESDGVRSQTPRQRPRTAESHVNNFSPPGKLNALKPRQSATRARHDSFGRNMQAPVPAGGGVDPAQPSSTASPKSVMFGSPGQNTARRTSSGGSSKMGHTYRSVSPDRSSLRKEAVASPNLATDGSMASPRTQEGDAGEFCCAGAPGWDTNGNGGEGRKGGGPEGLARAEEMLAVLSQQQTKEGSLKFDPDQGMTCTLLLGKQNGNICFGYDGLSERLFIYAPLVSCLPKPKQIRVRFLECLLSLSCLCASGCGVSAGISTANDCALASTSFSVLSSTPDCLCAIVPQFVQTLLNWRDYLKQKTLEWGQMAAVAEEEKERGSKEESPQSGGSS